MNNLQEIIQKVKELKNLINKSQNVYSAQAELELFSKMPRMQVNMEIMSDYIEQANVKYLKDGYYQFRVEVDGVEIIAVADEYSFEKYNLKKFIECVKGE